MAILFWRNSRSRFFPYFTMFSPSTVIRPRVGRLSRLRQRIRVDFPLPDNPMITKISPRFTSKETSRTPTVWPAFFKISSFDAPSSSRCSTDSGRGPKTLVTFSTMISAMALLLFEVVAIGNALGDSVDDNRQNHEGQPGLKPAVDIHPVDGDQHFHSEPLGPDQGSDHHHRQRHHGGLVDSRHDGGKGLRKLNLSQHLPAG